jgi:tryptophanyl-tRNA synthetase
MHRVLSGIQPSGIPTLGNYLGAVRNWVALQDTHECLFCIVDMHAITAFQEPAQLRRQILEMAATLLACGIDPARSTLFAQSAVSAHARLAWLFNCVARLGWLNRMTQFKDKAGKATRVPVGDDQRQHLELANDIAEKFNHDYGVHFFPRIEPLILADGARIMSLRDGTKKMSKSDPSDQSRINLTDDAETIALKIRRAKTDPLPLPANPAELAERPEARNLVAIYATMEGTDTASVLARFGGGNFGPFKEALSELLVAKLEPVASETKRLLSDELHLQTMLRDGAAKANALAEPIIKEAEKIIGFLA